MAMYCTEHIQTTSMMTGYFYRQNCIHAEHLQHTTNVQYYHQLINSHLLIFPECLSSAAGHYTAAFFWLVTLLILLGLRMHACTAEKQKCNNNFQNLNLWCAVNKKRTADTWWCMIQRDIQWKKHILNNYFAS